MINFINPLLKNYIQRLLVLKCKKKILFINPDKHSQYKSKIKVAVNPSPPLTLVSLASTVLNHEIRVIDMSLSPDYGLLIKNLKAFNPDYVCITCFTPSYNEAKKIIGLSKQYTNAKVILGGPHVSLFPKLCLGESKADIIVIKEGDFTLREIIEQKDLKRIKGICYKKDGKIILNPERPYIQNLDTLPFPAWHLLNIKKYNSSRLISKKNPLGPIETSRGCIYGCIYCYKGISGKKFRAKSPKRVVEEIKFMLNIGFKEVQVCDDCFTTDMERAKKICNLLLKERIKLLWSLAGIRVDNIDEKLVSLLKKAGCYRIAYGIESGNQKVLDLINKGITIEQVKKAIALTKKYKIETQGFFMLGLPGDTEETMQQTIDFAKRLDLDTCKANITMPFPGSPLYNKLKKTGAIKIEDSYLFSQQPQEEVYKHPNLEWETIYRYYSKFYKETVYNPRYAIKRVKQGLFNGQIFWDTYYFLKSLNKPF